MKNNRWSILVEPFLHLVFWMAVIYIVNATSSITYKDVSVINGYEFMTLNTKSVLPFVIVALSAKIIFIYTTSLFLLPKYFKKKNILKGSLLALLYLILTIAIELFAHTVIIRYTDLTFTELKQFIFLDGILYLLSTVIVVAYSFIRDWRVSQKKIIEMQQNQLATELNFLKSQINPHFLFNTLNNLFSMAQREGKENIADTVAKLSNLMRYMLHESNVKEIALPKEINYIKSYIELAQMRFTADEAKVQFDIKGNIQTAVIAPMLLIAFVENAFKHGVAIGKKSVLNFTLEVSENLITFSGNNPDYANKNKKYDEEHGIGLQNLEKRLSLIYPSNSNLQYASQEHIFSFVLQIPNLP